MVTSQFAQRQWTCPCGKVVSGIIGQGSHQRACRIFKEFRIASVSQTLVKMKDGTSYRGLSGFVLEDLIEKMTHDLDVLEAELSVMKMKGDD